MKRAVIFLTIISGLILSCNSLREKGAREILEKPKMRAEVIGVILGDQEYASQLATAMNESVTGKKVIAGNAGLLKGVLSNENMDKTLSNDKELMSIMISSIVKRMESDTAVSNMLYNRINESKSVKKYVKEQVCNPPKKAVKRKK